MKTELKVVILSAIVSGIVAFLVSIGSGIVLNYFTNPHSMKINSIGEIVNGTAVISIYSDTEGLSSNRIEIYSIINSSKRLQRVVTDKILNKENPIIIKIPLEKVNRSSFKEAGDGFCEFVMMGGYSNDLYPLKYKVECNNCENVNNTFEIYELDKPEMFVFGILEKNVLQGCEIIYPYYFWKLE